MPIRRRLLNLTKALLLFAGKAVLFFLFLAIAHPLVLLLVLQLAAMVALLVVVGGFLFVIAWMVALAMEHFFGGPFWFWMSLTGTGAGLCLIGLVSDLCKTGDCSVKPTDSSDYVTTAATAVIACNIQGAEGKFGDGVENR